MLCELHCSHNVLLLLTQNHILTCVVFTLLSPVAMFWTGSLVNTQIARSLPQVLAGLTWCPRMCISKKFLRGLQDHILRTVLRHTCPNKAFMPLLCSMDFCGPSWYFVIPLLLCWFLDSMWRGDIITTVCKGEGTIVDAWDVFNMGGSVRSDRTVMPFSSEHPCEPRQLSH